MSRNAADRQRAGIRRRAIESLTLNLAAEVLETGDPLEAILASHLREVSPHLDPDRLAKARRRVRARGEGAGRHEESFPVADSRERQAPVSGPEIEGRA